MKTLYTYTLIAIILLFFGCVTIPTSTSTNTIRSYNSQGKYIGKSVETDYGYRHYDHRGRFIGTSRR